MLRLLLAGFTALLIAPSTAQGQVVMAYNKAGYAPQAAMNPNNVVAFTRNGQVQHMPSAQGMGYAATGGMQPVYNKAARMAAYASAPVYHQPQQVMYHQPMQPHQQQYFVQQPVQTQQQVFVQQPVQTQQQVFVQEPVQAQQQPVVYEAAVLPVVRGNASHTAPQMQQFVHVQPSQQVIQQGQTMHYSQNMAGGQQVMTAQPASYTQVIPTQ